MVPLALALATTQSLYSVQLALHLMIRKGHSVPAGGAGDGSARARPLCAAAVSLLLGRIGRWSGREIACQTLLLACSVQAERDNESCFFVLAAGVHRFIKRRLTERVNELIHTESVYVEKLGHVVEEYVPAVAADPFLRNYMCDIFSNIEKIHRFHADEFLPALRHCDKDLRKLGQCFRKYPLTNVTVAVAVTPESASAAGFSDARPAGNRGLQLLLPHKE
ncbi:hypothetical protein EVAR_32577_1 [Eumeta japonica]|uniref:DH domain-containing protein n=1 Tax=Eumeta variegata TaxID=151549 RepID=A0A4C1VTH8_EUMVA|nr:hypothetical protein EVAR_32577_1 [Eumeta japonica]